jgi:hypothetical protein
VDTTGTVVVLVVSVVVKVLEVHVVVVVVGELTWLGKIIPIDAALGWAVCVCTMCGETVEIGGRGPRELEGLGPITGTWEVVVARGVGKGVGKVVVSGRVEKGVGTVWMDVGGTTGASGSAGNV